MQAQSLTADGFSLLEMLIALFILSLMVTVVLKHQVFLLEAQTSLEEKSHEARERRNQRLLQGPSRA